MIAKARKSLSLIYILKRYWWIIVSILILIPAISGAVHEAKAQDNWFVFFTFLGEELVSVDNIIYEKFGEKDFDFGGFDTTKEKIDGSYEFFKYLMNGVWKFLWIYFFIIVLLFKMFSFGTADNKFSKGIKASFFTILTLGLLQIIVSGVPFRGLIAFFKILIKFGVSF